MRPLLLLTALLLSSAASAQVQFSFTNTNTTTPDTLRFGKGRCGDVVSVTWTRTIVPCTGLTVWATSAASCPDAAAGTDYTVVELSQTAFNATSTGSFNVNIANLPFASGSACGTSADEATFRLCGATTTRDTYGTTCTSTVVKATPVKLTYDGKPPAAPVIASVAGLDAAVSATLTVDSDVTEVRMVVLREGAQVAEKRQGVGTSVVVDGLDNGVTYQVQAYAYDQAGNESAVSAAQDVTPIQTQGFLELYELAGGTPGCGVAGGGMTGGAVLAVLGFWLFSRRNRSWFEQ